MSIDACVISHKAKTWAYLGKLGAGGFSYGSNIDKGGKKTGSFIGQFLGSDLSITRLDDIPEGYQEWKDWEEEPVCEPIMGMKEIFSESEHSYQVLAEKHKEGHLVDFTIYEDDDLDPLFIGSIKWDGCSNWNFSYYQVHFCTKEQAKDFGVLLNELYYYAAELMPEHKKHIIDKPI